MSEMEIDSIWQAAFGDSARPELYTSKKLNEDGFPPLSDPQAFLLNITTLTRKQLYAASANNQIALKMAQDEYMDLERQIANIKSKNQPKNPQALFEHDVFEERKESVLYGYKYEANRPALLHAGIPGLRHADEVTEREKHDVRLFQEPFEQGGFVPKEKEYKAKLARARNPKNPDGWDPVMKNGKALIPKLQTHQDEYTNTYVRRNVDENGEIIRPLTPSSEVSGETTTPPKPVDKRLTRTRFDGKKHPPTREVSEAPSTPSTPGRKRAADSPAVDGGAETPNAKRQKLNAQGKPKHPNQYTKAREAREAKEAQEAAAAAAAVALAGPTASKTATPAPSGPTPAGADRPPWMGLSVHELRERKWTDEELVAAVKHDHLWLHDDPVQAEDWKWKIINGVNPVRSFSMFKKWAFWKAENKDKRPRGKKNLAAVNDATENTKTKKAASKPKPLRPEKQTASPSLPSSSIETVSVNGHEDTVRQDGTVKRGGGIGIKQLVNHDEPEGNDGYPSPKTKQVSNKVAEEGSKQNAKELDSSPASKSSLRREGSDSISVTDATPPKRRSLRNARRSSE
ncbi:hypothetical protein KCU88_g3606, partial [Aureobasidium melanogenum]